MNTLHFNVLHFQVQMVSNAQVQGMVQYGVYYNLAHPHYEGSTSVACDCCRLARRDSLALGGNDDVCIPCAVRFVIGAYCMGATVAVATDRVRAFTVFEVGNNTPGAAPRWNTILLSTGPGGRVTGGHSPYFCTDQGRSVRDNDYNNATLNTPGNDHDYNSDSDEEDR